MKDLIDEEKIILEAVMLEMANLYPTQTGLPVVVWFGEVGGQHEPRIKVSNTPGKFNRDSCFVLSVDKEPRVLTPKAAKIQQDKITDVIDWVKLNFDVLMKLWEIHESGDGDVEAELSKLRRL